MAKKQDRAWETNTSGEIRLQVPLSAEAVERIDALAERMQVGRGRVASMLLEEGIRDNEWIIRMVTSSVMQPVRDVVRGWGKKPATA